MALDGPGEGGEGSNILQSNGNCHSLPIQHSYQYYCLSRFLDTLTQEWLGNSKLLLITVSPHMIFRKINKKQIKKNNFVVIKMSTKAEDSYTQTDICTLITTEKNFITCHMLHHLISSLNFLIKCFQVILDICNCFTTFLAFHLNLYSRKPSRMADCWGKK